MAQLAVAARWTPSMLAALVLAMSVGRTHAAMLALRASAGSRQQALKGTARRASEAPSVLDRLDLQQVQPVPSPSPKGPSLDDGPVPPQEASRLQHILNIGESVEDFEMRQKPPFVSIPGQEAEQRLTPQQRKGITGIFGYSPDNFQDCVLVHQYAEPLSVIDSYETAEQGETWAQIYKNGTGEASEEDSMRSRNASSEKGKVAKDVLVRPGAVYDSATKDGQALHIGLQMFANLEGTTNPVQVVPVGPVARWSSKWRVPIAGFLCLEHEKSDSAPVLFSMPTPCVPTSMDAEGNELSPVLDKYEVFVGTTRLAFDSKLQAERFCLAYAEEIARDLKTTVWDAEQLKFSQPETQQIQEGAPDVQLSIGDICYRFCEDKSEPPVNLRSLCPADAPCSSPLSPETMSFDQCGAHAHTCGGVAPPTSKPPSVVTTAPSPASVVAPPPAAAAATKAQAEEPGHESAEAETSDKEAAEAEAEAKAALSTDGAFMQAQGEEGSERRGRLRHRRHGHHRRHSQHHHKDVFMQVGTNGTHLLNVVQRGHHQRHHHHHHHRSAGHRKPTSVAEKRLRMMAGLRSRPDDQDINERGQPSLGMIRNPDLLSFVVNSRHRGGAPQGWTLGTKKLLVLVMDWKAGDESLAPYSKQASDPLAHYRQIVFPEVQRHFSEMSYGQFGLDVTFVPEVVRYTKNRNQIAGRMPFPALYNEARESLQGHPRLGSQFAFRDYDLVYVIHPQVKPVGTKGVAWVGSRGAVCNGCETISDNFKVMVAVHELGHNLGLSHASSEALEYGNPFDWMGNYPDVVGLSYGLGYKTELAWIQDANLLDVSDGNVENLNDMVTLMPFDTTKPPRPGQVVGVRISLRENAEDIYLSYRATATSTNRGLFVVYQSKDSPNSKLMDAACHSASQQDAHLRKGWTFMDGSQKVVVKVVEEASSYVKVHLYRTPSASNAVAGIRARKDFTDGSTKCPVTCQDSDLIISQSCTSLKDQGYCTGTMRLQGNKLSIGMQVCPETCGKCPQVMAQSPELSGGGCEDKNIKISGMDCGEIARRDLCSSRTTSGKKLGADLCRRSCGECPKAVPPSASGSAGDFPDPTPARAVGGEGSALQAAQCPSGCQAPVVQAGAAGNGGVALNGNICTARASQRFGDIRYCGLGGAYAAENTLDCSPCKAQAPKAAPACPYACQAPTCTHGSNINGGLQLSGDKCIARCSNSYGEQRFCGAGGVYSEPGSVDCTGCVGAGLAAALRSAEDEAEERAADALQGDVCEDDLLWVDVDGHNCEAYKNSISKWGKERTCRKHLGGEAAVHCRATCGTCKGNHIKSSACADNACVGPWMQAYGRCFRCSDFARACTDEDTKEVFHAECPLTCGVCKKKEHESDEDDDNDGSEEEDEDGEKDGDTAEAKCVDEAPDFCADLGMRYCSEHKFAKQCRKTCDLCPPPGPKDGGCRDVFSAFTCARYESYGWCTRQDTRDSIRMQCPLTCGVCSGPPRAIKEDKGDEEEEVEPVTRAVKPEHRRRRTVRKEPSKHEPEQSRAPSRLGDLGGLGGVWTVLTAMLLPLCVTVM